MTFSIDRRRVLKGMLQGSAVTVALPLLNCFLNDNGTALASGAPLPMRFGTWFWGLGMTANRFIPKTLGANYDLLPELEPLKDVKQHVNVFTRYAFARDDNPNLCHYTGWVGLRSGSAPSHRQDLPGESMDVTIAKKIGGYTRFRTLDATATANPRDSVSFLGPNAYNTPEISPIALYTRVFGPEFQDPNSTTFRPRPEVLMQQSVLSGVLDKTKSLQSQLGAEDRARLDQYFTGLRDVENQLSHQLQKPEPREACVVPKAPPKEIPAGLDYKLVEQRHKLMTDILVMAAACDQTRVFNMFYSSSTALTTKPGLDSPHHVSTHDEPIDAALGYQISPSWFVTEAMKNFAYYVAALAAVREGDGSLLDNTLVYAHSDQEFAKIHSVDGIPMFTAGRAGGRIKTGLHLSGEGREMNTRLPLTAMKLMGVEIDAWGGKTNRTNKPIGEIMA
jgi:Protein of unknown function (DUF1552)